MKAWLNSLSSSERTLVLSAGIALLLLFFWLLIAKPLYDNHSRLNRIILSQKNTLKTMQKQRIQIKQLQQQNNKPVTTNNQNPQQLIERSLQTWRLKPSLERMQSQGAKGVRLILKNVNADRVMRFLYELENKNALSITDMVINNAKKEVGFADVRLTIKKLNK